MTTSSRSCTRSNVAKRKLHARRTRRRRMTEESSVGRESLTCVSRLPQFGHRMEFPLPHSSARQFVMPAKRASSYHPSPDGGTPCASRLGVYWCVHIGGR